LLKLETSVGQVVCLAIFSISSSSDGPSRIELGCIQGARPSDRQVTRTATRDLESIRPKHFLIAMLYAFARCCRIDSVDGVGTKLQVGRVNTSFFANYDALWLELGGELDGKGQFYTLPSDFSYRLNPGALGGHRSRHRRRKELKASISEMLQRNLM